MLCDDLLVRTFFRRLPVPFVRGAASRGGPLACSRCARERHEPREEYGDVATFYRQEPIPIEELVVRGEKQRRQDVMQLDPPHQWFRRPQSCLSVLINYMFEEVQIVQAEAHKHGLGAWLSLDNDNKPLFEGVQVVLLQRPCHLQAVL